MARKNTNLYPIALNQSLATSFTTTPTIVTYMDNIGYQINVTTTDSIGSFAVQISNDYSVNEVGGENVLNPGNWSALDLSGGLSGTPIVNTANDVINITLTFLPFKAVRLAYTSSTAGTGHADIWISTKQSGG